MQEALGLMGDQATMLAITIALGVGGLAALFMALLWPKRWHLPYRMEVGFVVLPTSLDRCHRYVKASRRTSESIPYPL
ncbi:MAG: hypothetical protein OES46_09550 [Gammaproteobacteria bacterium]|nr:hypothetical protein [Gammaproteobacteria bacterium]